MFEIKFFLRGCLRRALMSLCAAAYLAGFMACGSGLLITEVQWSNPSLKFPDIPGTPDWVEVYNSGEEALNLSGYGLSDDVNRPFRWRFPSRLLPPGGLVLVYLAGDDVSGPVDVAPSSPDGISGMDFWFDAGIDDSLTLTGSLVREWRSNGGAFGDEAHLLSPDTQSGSSPVRIDDSHGNPVKVLQFDGVDDRMSLEGVDARIDNWTETVVFRTDVHHQVEEASDSGVGGVEGQRYLLWPDHGGEVGAGAGLSVGSNGVAIYEHGSSYMPARVSYDRDMGSGWQVVSVVYRDGKAALFVNGIMWAGGSAAVRGPVSSSTIAGGGSYGWFAGSLHSLVRHDRPLESHEIRAIHAWFSVNLSAPFFQPLVADFRLDRDSEPAVLWGPGNRILDQMDPVDIPIGFSAGRSAGDINSTGIIDNPTPGLPNAEDIYTGIARKVTLSHPSGYHGDGFPLTVTNPDPLSTDRYTLDGSMPDEDDPVFPEILTVNGQLPPVPSLMMIPTGGGWEPPVSHGPQAVSLTVRRFRKGFVPGPPTRRTFFLSDRTMPASGSDLPVFSVHAEPDDFFDSSRGIYVPGIDGTGNFWNRGEAWEREVFVEFFDGSPHPSISSDMGVRIFGGTSRQFPQKSLRFYTNRNASGEDLAYRLFPDRPRTVFDRFILRQSGHDHNLTFFRDGFMTSVGRRCGLEVQAFRPVILFLNGEYWGLHNLRESFDEGYFYENYGVPTGELNLVEGFFRADSGTSSDLENLYGHLRQPASDVMENRRLIESMVDVENFLTYKAVETFFYRWDTGNLKRWKAGDGRWRWLWFDSDVGSGGFASVSPAWEFDMLAYNLEPDGPWSRYPLNNHNNPTMTLLFRRVLEIPEWREWFILRYCDLLNTELQAKRLLDAVDTHAAMIENDMVAHIRRWRRPSTVTSWRSAIADIKEFAVNRPTQAFQNLSDYFNLGPFHRLTFGEWNPSNGQLRLNTLDPGSVNPGFSGRYSESAVLTIKAQPEYGHAFTGWKEIPGNRDPDVRLRLKGDFRLTPVFVKLPDHSFSILISRPDGDTHSVEIDVNGAVSPDHQWALSVSRDLNLWETERIVRASELPLKWNPVPAGGEALFFRLEQHR